MSGFDVTTMPSNRFTEQEIEQLRALATKSGMTKTEYLRALVREQHMQLVQAGFLEPVSADEHVLARRRRPYVASIARTEEPLS